MAKLSILLVGIISGFAKQMGAGAGLVGIL